MAAVVEVSLTPAHAPPATRADNRRGSVEGTNRVIERHSANGIRERLAEVASDAVRSAPDVIFTIGMAQILKDSTKTIPIVAIENDPITTGLVGILSHPGGNLTGAIVDAGVSVWEKRFELLSEVAPAASIVHFLAHKSTGKAHSCKPCDRRRLE